MYFLKAALDFLKKIAKNGRNKNGNFFNDISFVFRNNTVIRKHS